MSEKEEKIHYMTIAKALGILTVISSHLGGIFNYIGLRVYKNRVPRYLFPPYSFHMPLFIFASGYFYRDYYIGNIKKLGRKRFNSMIKPYYRWNLFYGIVVTLLLNFGLFDKGSPISIYNIFISPIFKGYQFNLNGASWFVISLFFIQIFYTGLRSLLKKNDLKTNRMILVYLYLIATISIYISNKINILDHNLLLFVLRTLFGIFFYHLGYYFNLYVEDRLVFSIKTLGLIIVFKLLLVYTTNNNFTMSMRIMEFKGFNFIPIVYAIIGILFIINLSKIIMRLIDEKNLKSIREVFIFIESNSYHIMMHHMGANLIFNSLIKNKLLKFKVAKKMIDLIIRPVFCTIVPILFGKLVENIKIEVKELEFNN